MVLGPRLTRRYCGSSRCLASFTPIARPLGVLFTCGIGSTNTAVCASPGSLQVVLCRPPAVALSRFRQPSGTLIVKIAPVLGTSLMAVLFEAVLVALVDVAPRWLDDEPPPPPLRATTATIAAMTTTPMSAGST